MGEAADKLREGFHGADTGVFLALVLILLVYSTLGLSFLSFTTSIGHAWKPTQGRGQSACLSTTFWADVCYSYHLLSFCPFAASVCFHTSHDDYDICFFARLWHDYVAYNGPYDSDKQRRQTRSESDVTRAGEDRDGGNVSDTF